jgi:hypothetical protein
MTRRSKKAWEGYQIISHLLLDYSHLRSTSHTYIPHYLGTTGGRLHTGSCGLFGSGQSK